MQRFSTTTRSSLRNSRWAWPTYRFGRAMCFPVGHARRKQTSAGWSLIQQTMAQALPRRPLGYPVGGSPVFACCRGFQVLYFSCIESSRCYPKYGSEQGPKSRPQWLNSVLSGSPSRRRPRWPALVYGDRLGAGLDVGLGGSHCYLEITALTPSPFAETRMSVTDLRDWHCARPLRRDRRHLFQRC